MYPGERGIDLSLYWHQPSIIAWQIYRCVGGRLAEHREGWSSRGHGTHSLVRSVKHQEPAFWVGNWAAWALPHVVQNVMLSLDLKSIHKSYVCIAHSTEGVFHMPFRSLGLHGFFSVVPSARTATSIDVLYRLQKHSYTCDFNLEETQFLLWPLSLLYELKAVHLLESMPSGQLLGDWHPMFPAVSSWNAINEEKACSKENGLGRGASCTFV